MGGMTTFNNNDSISSHGEESISLLNRIAEITKEAYKYLPEKDCTFECGVFVDVDSRVFLHAIQHIRESIEAYRDLTEELDEDISKLRKMCEAFAGKCPYRDKYCGGDFEDCVECDYAKKLVVNKDAERLFEQLQEDCENFRNLAISRNKELEQEREKSTQLEQRCSELVIDRDKAVEYWTKYCETLLQKHREELAAKECEIYKLNKQGLSSLYGKVNNPCNFCGNCRYYAQMGKDDGEFEGICTQHYIKRVDPDDASCEHFKPTYDTRVVIGKPEFPVCEKCNHEDCSNCTLCPF